MDGLVTFVTSVGSSNGRAGVGSVVRSAVVVSSSRRSKTTSCWDSADFRVAVTSSTVSLAVALPELDAGALGVTIRGAGTERLLLLVVATEEDLEECRKEEEDTR
jgi:hypothetical protein